jgi:hypothetical protein
MAKPLQKISAAEIFAMAVRSHVEAKEAAQTAKVKAIISGWSFLQAKMAAKHGEFELLCETHAAQIPFRTVQRYIAFVEDALVSVIAEQKQLTDSQVRALVLTDADRKNVDLFTAAKDVILHSSANFVSLARELSIFRKFGEYDGVQYANAKARQAALGQPVARQVEFDFTLSSSGVKSLLAIATAPEDKLPPRDKLTSLRDDLRNALAAVEARLGQVIDVTPPVPHLEVESTLDSQETSAPLA